MVMSMNHPALTFNLSLVRTEPTYNQPVQQWTFMSDFAVSVSHPTTDMSGGTESIQVLE